MSERGPAAPSTSGYQTSGSPVGGNQGSLPGAQHSSQGAGGSGLSYDHGATPHTNGDVRSQQVPQRLLGVHNILNPSEPHMVGSEGGVVSLPRTREHEDAGASPVLGQHPPSRSFSLGQRGSGSHPGTPVGPPFTGLAPPGSEHESPSSSYSHPTLQNPRRILTPRGARASSVGRGGPSREPDPALQSRMPSVSPAKRPYEGNSPEDYWPPPAAGNYPSSAPHTPNLPGASISRSVSQPATQPAGGPHVPPAALSPRDAHVQGPVSPAQAPLQPSGAYGSRSFSTSAAAGPTREQGQAPWHDSIQESGLGSSMMVGEGEGATFMALPGNPIPITIDYSQASKKASEKRQRNAKASTRHRRKRKALQEESARQLQDLKEEREDMELRVEELIAQRDFYRNDRNRLRDIVRATPAISEFAAGPPSPTLTGPSETSPVGRSHHAPTPSWDYSSEASSSVERPTQRPRLDDRSDIWTPSYGTTSTGASGAHTPIQGSAYGPAPRPPSASSSTGAVDMLPPLRSMEGPPPAHGRPHEQDPRTGQWVPIQPRQYETGWATAPPRKPADGSSR